MGCEIWNYLDNDFGTLLMVKFIFIFQTLSNFYHYLHLIISSIKDTLWQIYPTEQTEHHIMPFVSKILWWYSLPVCLHMCSSISYCLPTLLYLNSSPMHSNLWGYKVDSLSDYHTLVFNISEDPLHVCSIEMGTISSGWKLYNNKLFHTIPFIFTASF